MDTLISLERKPKTAIKNNENKTICNCCEKTGLKLFRVEYKNEMTANVCSTCLVDAVLTLEGKKITVVIS